MKIKKGFFITIIFWCRACAVISQDLPSTASLIYPGVDGKLTYVADSAGNRIPDFSNAGYKGGGVAIPLVPVKATVWPVAGGNSPSIQAAIDKVSALPPDASGFRGAVLLKLGTYLLEKPVVIRTSGVVLRGEGMSDIGTILIGKTQKENPQPPPGRNIRPALITVSGSSGTIPQEGSKQAITNSYVPVGSNSFTVATAKLYKPGDKVLVRRYGNEDWISELGQDTMTVWAGTVGDH